MNYQYMEEGLESEGESASVEKVSEHKVKKSRSQHSSRSNSQQPKTRLGRYISHARTHKKWLALDLAMLLCIVGFLLLSNQYECRYLVTDWAYHCGSYIGNQFELISALYQGLEEINQYYGRLGCRLQHIVQLIV